MSGHLCLKWNNHTSAFINSISKIHAQDKPRYCDATIVSQGKYFPVHRIVLSTCSDYFEELFERMECQHPYIVFKDIEPKDMELLLNYMYQGEVNVVQENLPNLIKAAEALRIKGLAVPDDMPSNKESSGKKRSSTSNGHPTPKRRAEERRKRDPSYSLHPEAPEGEDFSRSERISDSSDKEIRFKPQEIEVDEIKNIKEEPVDHDNFNSGVAPSNFGAACSSEPPETSSMPGDPSTADQGEFVPFPPAGESSFIKMENEGSMEGSFDQLSSSWGDLGGGDSLSQPLPPEDMTGQDDMSETSLWNTEHGHCSRSFTAKVLGSAEVSPAISPIAERSTVANDLRGTEGYTCSLCDYKSIRKSSVKRHLKFKHDKERPFACSVCSKKFLQRNDLQIHFRIHTGEKPFSCPKCRRTFRQRQSVVMHLKKKYECA